MYVYERVKFVLGRPTKEYMDLNSQSCVNWPLARSWRHVTQHLVCGGARYLIGINKT